MEIKEVFTPRNPHVNLKIYVPRLDLERALLRAVEGSMHSLLFGESGNGKSWLYKKVLEQNLVTYRVANCANASRLKSLTQEICSVLVAEGDSQKTGFTENKETAIKAVVAEGKLTHQDQFKVQQKEPLLYALHRFREVAGSETAVLVLDNLESIFGNQERMDELADIIILLDDPRYAASKIKLLIVGVPNGVLAYFARTKNMESVANRLEEVRKVDGLTMPMVTTLVTKGFNDLLRFGINLVMLESIAKHVHDVTMGVAQRVHEYCEKLAYIIEDGKKVYRPEMLEEADREWLRVGLRQAYTAVESHLNSKRTTIARRNQVIYCIGKIQSHQFDSAKITETLIDQFPETVSETNMGIGSILSDLASGESPILSKNPKTNEYRVADPRYVMCIRIMLRLDRSTKTVEKRLFST